MLVYTMISGKCQLFIRVSYLLPTTPLWKISDFSSILFCLKKGDVMILCWCNAHAYCAYTTLEDVTLSQMMLLNKLLIWWFTDVYPHCHMSDVTRVNNITWWQLAELDSRCGNDIWWIRWTLFVTGVPDWLNAVLCVLYVHAIWYAQSTGRVCDRRAWILCVRMELSWSSLWSVELCVPASCVVRASDRRRAVHDVTRVTVSLE